jgi:lysophospholipase L1-like esterase
MSSAMIFLTCLRLAFVSNAAMPAGADGTTEKIRVACVGDSITFGFGIKDREHGSYPARLALLLGDKYEVRNFGVSGATLIKRGTRPYDQQEACREALKFRPQLAIIMLGTNDTNKQTWPEHKEDFVADYAELITKFREASPDIQLWVCLPPPLVRDRGKEWDTDAILNEEVAPKVKAVAKESKVELIDLNSIFADRSVLLPDGVHPNAEGAELMARTVQKSLQKQSASKTSNE